VVAARDLDPADTDTEMVGDELADGDIGLVVDRCGHDADHQAARPVAHFVSASPRDHSNLEMLVVTTHEP
jgi:hypothetical protein